ncbi:MAG: hypothetical protein IT422_15100 [Pirellulaceae bacterium]|nr:hypothetical protein [Pirellulaceae bacterium]
MYLLLDQNDNQSYWTNKLTEYGFLIQPVDAVAERLDLSEQWPRYWPHKTIIVLFPKAKSEDNDDVCELVRRICGASQSNPRDKPLTIWCHYGGQLTYDGLERRWSSYDRITVECKEAISACIRDTGLPNSFPLPFSWNQDHAWKSEFQELRRIAPDPTRHSDAVKLLVEAATKVGEQLDYQARFADLNSAAPACIAFRELSAKLPMVPKLGDWERFRDLTNSYGFGLRFLNHGGKKLVDKRDRIDSAMALLSRYLSGYVSGIANAHSDPHVVLTGWQECLKKLFGDFATDYNKTAKELRDQMFKRTDRGRTNPPA